jgi:UDP-glucose 4-epimerase
VLVTGGAGFIGSHLVEALARRGDHVVVVDNLTTGSRDNLAAVPDDRLTLIDTTVSEALPHLQSVDFKEIYHLAAAVGVRLVIEEPIRTIETNVLETSALLRFAAKNDTPTLIASTSEVYGKGTKTPFAEDDEVVYGPTVFSRWSYACSKAIDEYIALAYHREHGLPVVIMRFFNTVGPRQSGEYGMVLPRFVAAALQGKPLEVHGDGQQTRCFCDVRDVVAALPQVLSQTARGACAGRVMNIGSERLISIADLAKLVRDTLSSESQIVHVPYETAFGPGFEDLRTRQPDLKRIREAVGFSARYDLQQTIRDIAEKMRERAATSQQESVA